LASGDLVPWRRDVTPGVHIGRRGGHVGADDDAGITDLQTSLGGDAALRLDTGCMEDSAQAMSWWQN